MTSPGCSLHSPETLRELVRRMLCEPDCLDPDRYELTESALIRQGRSCGVAYCLHGPRAVRLTAIWSTDEQMLYCYNSRGERMSKTLVQVVSEVSKQAA